MKKFFFKYKKIVINYLIALFIIVFTIFLYLNYYNNFANFGNKIRDLMFVERGVQQASSDIVIVDIDEKSLAKIGQWPWSRDILAQMVYNLAESGAGVIGFDIVFAESDNSSPKKIADKYDIPSENLPNYDEIFAQAVANTPTILGYVFDFDNPTNFDKEKLPQIPAIVIEKNKKSDDFILTSKGIVQNLDILQDNSYSSGFFNVIPDNDGVSRSVPLVIKYKDYIYPSLGLEMIRAALGVKKITINYSELGIENVQLGDLTIPTDRFGRLFINYKGPKKTYKYLSAVDIIDKNFDKSFVEGKYILIGTSASGLLDLRVSPFDTAFVGVEVHANMIDNILNQDFIYRPLWAEAVDFAIIIAVVFVLTTVLIFTSPLIASISSISLLVILYYIYRHLLFHEGLVFNMIFPLLAFMFTLILNLISNYFFETKQKELIKAKFAKKVSPSVMEDLIKNPDELSMEGKEKFITIFFSDIRDFTTLSEAMGSPKALIELLNEYMTPMVDIIIEHKGTVDKFIGDAIMAYWNAPNDLPNHEDFAVSAAIKQIHALKDLNVKLKNEKKPPIDIGIGINSGLSTVGEMGSFGRSDYTVIGDPVNLASRLEGLNKPYGSHIIISEFTKANLKNDYIIRDLDLVRVKGKKEPVNIFQVLDFGVADDKLKEFIDIYHEALKFYRSSNFTESKELFEQLLKDDESAKTLYSVYIDRCNHYIENPPVDFDGVFTFTTK
ncbi:MAG: adenylate/guanylate cyclase domain-containing protein [Campylobacterales bacterium]|nr:adenylate/guanylate cyclase domain-containing protein [Campylobacterales bacterium]